MHLRHPVTIRQPMIFNSNIVNTIFSFQISNIFINNFKRVLQTRAIFSVLSSLEYRKSECFIYKSACCIYIYIFAYFDDEASVDYLPWASFDYDGKRKSYVSLLVD